MPGGDQVFQITFNWRVTNGTGTKESRSEDGFFDANYVRPQWPAAV